MHDIKLIRTDPAAFDAALARRGLEPMSHRALALDEARRNATTRAQELQTRRNDLSREIGIAKKNGDAADDLVQEVGQIKHTLGELEDEQKALDEELRTFLSGIPNLPDADVPDGASEDDNVELRRWGTPTVFDFDPKEHDALGEALGMMDFETAAKLSGARFVVLNGALARMERALGQLMLDVHTGEFGYTETQTPVLVRSSALYGTGQLPKFADDLFRVEDDRWLIPTAEVSLTNIVANEIVGAGYLPRRYAALSNCFRSEAGAAGKDTRGMIRQHQFSKVELVSVVKPEESEAELDRMTGCAEAILQKLGLPYRVLALCTGDMGFSAARTYDLEVWLPGQQRYREISSCSNTRDFQARRMNARFREAGQKGGQFVHTLNGSGLAIGRTLVAVIENYQQADGSIVVPEALRPYMGGLELIAAS